MLTTDTKLVKSALPGGFKDYSPDQTAARQLMLRSIETTLQRFAFVPLETSIAQRREVLTGGKLVENRLWDMAVSLDDILRDGRKIQSELDNAAERITARFDLTVPLARYVAANMSEIALPLRRYEYGNVFRGESAQAGRFNQFIQFDADIVGADVGPADAEIVLCMAAVMADLGIERFLIKVNDRKVLNGLAERVGPELGSRSVAALLRAMDKADKIGIDGVLAELRASAATVGDEAALSFDDQQCKLVREFMTLTDGLMTNCERLEALRTYFGGVGIGAEGVSELTLIASLLTAGGMPEDKWIIDPSIARGLGYYTGPVFETTLLDLPRFGSVYSGGRFDDLVARFTGESLPSVGASVGVDRLFAALEELGTASISVPFVDVYIIVMDQVLMPDYFRMASELRSAGVAVEINMNYQDPSLRKQNGLAIFARRAPVVLYYGMDEVARDVVGLKKTADRTQTWVPRADLVSAVLGQLGR